MPLRQVLLGLVHTGQRQQVLRPPRQSVLLRHRRKGKQVDGRFKQIQHWRRLLGGDGKGKSLIAARRFSFEVCPDSPQAGITGLAGFILADKYGIEKIVTICPIGKELKLEEMTCAYEEKEGMLVNSGEFTGMEMHKAMSAIMDKAEAEGFGKRRVNYRLRDWLISRQRYWGAPIPVIYCKKCGTVLVPEKDLPVKLPEDVTENSGTTDILVVEIR